MSANRQILFDIDRSTYRIVIWCGIYSTLSVLVNCDSINKKWNRVCVCNIWLPNSYWTGILCCKWHVLNRVMLCLSYETQTIVMFLSFQDTDNEGIDCKMAGSLRGRIQVLTFRLQWLGCVSFAQKKLKHVTLRYVDIISLSDFVPFLQLNVQWAYQPHALVIATMSQ